VACKPAVDTLGGAVVVFGTPGEELYGGKSTMAAAGAFDGIDAAMISHPGGGNRILMNTLACENLEVKFKGAAAHAAAAPELGINALDAMILSFNAINALRQQLRSCERVSGVITNGGEAANIIPEHTAAIFILRAEDGVHLDALKKKVIACFAGASRTTGAKLKYSWGERYEAMVSNVAMAKLFRENMRSLGQNIDLGGNSLMYFSTDVGNVSQLAPTIQPLVAIAPEGVLIHTPRFAKAAATGEALRCMLDAAKAMAMTAIDLFSSPEKMAEVQKEFFKDK
jgi:amidohydrolase